MASQRNTHKRSFLCFLTLVSVTVHAFAAANDPQDKVNLSLYYESLCPYCADFIVNHLVKIFRTDLINIVNLRLVPWGNTQISPNNTWICQHGRDECRLDVAEACAINTWPKMETHFAFIHCVERLHLMNRHGDWKSCFGAKGLDPGPVKTCYSNGIGYKIEKAYADETLNLRPRHRFVPWVVVNNHPLQEDFQNFIAYVCRAYRGNKMPEACEASSSSDLTASEAATSKQVSTRRETKT